MASDAQPVPAPATKKNCRPPDWRNPSSFHRHRQPHPRGGEFAPTAPAPASPSREEAEWLTRALSSLGHPDPPSVSPCVLIPGNDGDICFSDLTYWLEHRCIRQWTISERESSLRYPARRFWSSVGLTRYLDGLDCPPELYRTSGWIDEPPRRIGVVRWLVSCAVSEVYCDSKGERGGFPRERDDHVSAEQRRDHNNGGDGSTTRLMKSRNNGGGSVPVRPTGCCGGGGSARLTKSCNGDTASAQPTVPPSWVSSASSSDDFEAFPLGFRTGDKDVDRIVTMLRMRHILDLRAEQDGINTALADMQRLTVKGGEGSG